MRNRAETQKNLQIMAEILIGHPTKEAEEMFLAALNDYRTTFVEIEAEQNYAIASQIKTGA